MLNDLPETRICLKKRRLLFLKTGVTFAILRLSGKAASCMHVLKTFRNGILFHHMLTFISPSPTALCKKVCVKRIRLINVTVFKSKYFYRPSVRP